MQFKQQISSTMDGVAFKKVYLYREECLKNMIYYELVYQTQGSQNPARYKEPPEMGAFLM